MGSKERIKREAMRLFVEHGVDAVSMRDIADAVGMKAPSLYAHFRSREDLIGELFFASYAEYGRQVAAAVASPGGFRRQLAALVAVICALHGEDELLFNFLLLTQHGFLRQVPSSEANPGRDHLPLGRRRDGSRRNSGRQPDAGRRCHHWHHCAIRHV